MQTRISTWVDLCVCMQRRESLDESPKTAVSVSGGWMYVLSGLKTLLETGEPLSDRRRGAASAG